MKKSCFLICQPQKWHSLCWEIFLPLESSPPMKCAMHDVTRARIIFRDHSSWMVTVRIKWLPHSKHLIKPDLHFLSQMRRSAIRMGFPSQKGAAKWFADIPLTFLGMAPHLCEMEMYKISTHARCIRMSHDFTHQAQHIPLATIIKTQRLWKLVKIMLQTLNWWFSETEKTWNPQFNFYRWRRIYNNWSQITEIQCW